LIEERDLRKPVKTPVVASKTIDRLVVAMLLHPVLCHIPNTWLNLAGLPGTPLSMMPGAPVRVPSILIVINTGTAMPGPNCI
jgi:hypothetical protein